MANSKQATKRARQAEVRNTRNRAGRQQIRTIVKNAETAIAQGGKKDIPEAFTTAMRALHSGVKKGLVKKATASRKISRLAARIRAKAS